MSCTNVACIHRVVLEVLACHGSGLVADQSVLCHSLGVELHLNAGIAGDGVELGVQLIDQATVTRIDEHAVHYETGPHGGHVTPEEVPANTVVIAKGLRAKSGEP